MTMGVRAAVINRRREILLITHTYASGWQLPGGGVEPGEATLDSLKRELLEEAGVTAIRNPKLFNIYNNSADFPRDHVLLYLVTDFDLEGFPKPNREINGHGFFPLNDLPENTTIGTKMRIAELLGKRKISQNW